MLHKAQQKTEDLFREREARRQSIEADERGAAAEAEAAAAALVARSRLRRAPRAQAEAPAAEPVALDLALTDTAPIVDDEPSWLSEAAHMVAEDRT